MFNFNLVMKGLLIGIAKIIPGVSGSLIAVSLGLYDKAIEAISHPFKNFKYNLCFLGNIGTGVLISIVLFSNFILFFINRFFFVTVVLLVGFIIGSFPSFFKSIEKLNLKDYFIIGCIIILILMLSFFRSENIYEYTPSFLNNIFVFFCGFLDALSMVIPGISGTAIFLIMGCYSFVLSTFSSIYNIFELSTILFLVGMVIGIIVVSNVMSYLLCQYRKKTYLGITGFAVSSILLLCFDLFTLDISLVEIVAGIVLFFTGIKISYKLNC